MITLNFHAGHVLGYLADKYPTLPSSILEYVQNAVDAHASNIHIKVDFKKKEITISDNGYGIDPLNFEEKLSEVGKSNKVETSQTGLRAYGRYGIGMMSAFGKCDEFTITSARKANYHIYYQWKFSNELIDQNKIDNLEREQQEFLLYNGSDKSITGNKKGVSWRTQVKIKRFKTHKNLFDQLLDLPQNIVDRYNEGLKIHKTEVEIKIIGHPDKNDFSTSFKAKEYLGEKLETIVYEDESDRTIIDLYLALKQTKGRKGRVNVGIKFDPFRIPLDVFIKNVNLFKRETIDILTSGVFEGEIISEKCILHPNRIQFQENDAVYSFVDQIEKWVEFHGKKYLSSLKDEEKYDRYNRLGKQSMSYIKNLLRLPEFSQIKEAFHSFTKGLVGPDDRDYNRNKKKPGVNVKDTDLSKPKDPKGKTDTHKPPDDTKEPKPRRRHFNLTDENGTEKKIVEMDGFGIIFAHEELANLEKLWIFDKELGLLTFNVRHGIWQKVNTKDRWICALQEHVTIAILNLLSQPASYHDVVLNYVEKDVDLFAYQMFQKDEPIKKPVKQIGRKFTKILDAS